MEIYRKNAFKIKKRFSKEFDEYGKVNAFRLFDFFCVFFGLKMAGGFRLEKCWFFYSKTYTLYEICFCGLFLDINISL